MGFEGWAIRAPKGVGGVGDRTGVVGILFGFASVNMYVQARNRRSSIRPALCRPPFWPILAEKGRPTLHLQTLNHWPSKRTRSGCGVQLGNHSPRALKEHENNRKHHRYLEAFPKSRLPDCLRYALLPSAGDTATGGRCGAALAKDHEAPREWRGTLREKEPYGPYGG